MGMENAPSAHDSTTWLGGGNGCSWGYECTRGGLWRRWLGKGPPRLLGQAHTTAKITVNATALEVKIAAGAAAEH